VAETGEIDISVVFQGAQQASQQIGSVTGQLGGLGTAAQQSSAASAQAGVSLQGFAQAAQTSSQRIQGVASAVQTLAATLGSRDRTGSLVAGVAGSVAQFAAMGSMLGPGGTVVGGVVGLAAGVVGLAGASRDAAEAAQTQLEAERRLGEISRETADGVRGLAAAIRDRAAASSLLAGVASELEYAEAIDDTRERIDALNIDYSALQDEMREHSGDTELLASMADQRASISETIVSLESLIGSYRSLSRAASAESSEIMAEGLAGGAPAPSGGGGGGEAPTTTIVDMNERYREESARIMGERLEGIREANAEMLTWELERIAAQEEAEREHARRVAEIQFDLQAEMNQAAADAEQQRAERAAEGLLAMKEAQESADSSALDGRRSMATEMTGLFGSVTMSFGKTLAAIATGEKTASEAFEGLAKAFLEMISQYTTLKAATEFAEAGAAAASYNWGGFAAHIAAGVAFTAVAIATGVGAAAINSPPQAPARPEAGGERNEGGGGDVVINWNGPIVTAGTRAELGREVRNLVGEAASI